MIEDDRKYFESQIDMFASEGWKHFAEQVEKMHVSTDSISGVAPDDVRFKQGELSIIRWVLAWPKLIQAEYDNQLAEDVAPPPDANL
jgi:hypothetical protein